jgi:hypothetical protein
MLGKITNKKPAWILASLAGGIILGLALLIVLFFTAPKKPDQANKSEPSQVTTQKVDVKSSAPTGPLPFLPADFPLDKSAQITNNYTASSAQTDSQQYTRAFTSTQPLTTIYKTYSDYFAKNTWFVQAQNITAATAVLTAFKDKVAVTISIQQLKTSRFIVISVGQADASFTVPNLPQNAPPPH